MVWEVLLIDFRVVSIGGAPGEVSCSSNVEFIAKLVVEIDGDVAHNASRHGAFTSTQHEGIRDTCGHGYADINKFTLNHIVLHTNNMGANRIRLEDVGHDSAHCSVGGRVCDGLARHSVAMLIDHVGRDGQGFIGSDG